MEKRQYKLAENTNNDIVLLLDEILKFAVSIGASDIHIDPREADLLIRVRVDGLLEEVGILPKTHHEEIIARLKIMAGMRTDIHLLPQDGRWHVCIDDQKYNLRLSIMPTYHGENSVIRLLPGSIPQNVGFEELGFSILHAEIIRRVMSRPNGLILVTGPTGSGKTTTIHRLLLLKSREPISIITLEDPVEYEVPGVRQIHVRHSQGVTFASGLRASLRQDPNIIMLGEIRDSETSKVAIHTALTGHLVVSTLHTNSALETIPRLADMGIDSYLLSSTLRLVIAQRLVRKVCDKCYGDGCGICRGSGFFGRVVIAELLEFDSELSKLVEKKAALSECESYIRKNGFISIAEDGFEKTEWGITTRNEVSAALFL